MSEEAPAPAQSRADIRQCWRERLDRFATAGLSVVAFCQAEGVATQTFYYWKHKFAPRAATPDAERPRLLPVRLLQGPTPVEIVLPTGFVLRLLPGCDLAWVRSLLEALGGPPC